MDKTRSEQKNVLNRLKRAEGQIRGVQKMIEEEMYRYHHSVKCGTFKYRSCDGHDCCRELERLFRESRKRSSRTSTEAGTSDSDDHQEIVALFFRKRLFS